MWRSDEVEKLKAAEADKWLMRLKRLVPAE
jgi:hypothetical protein